MSQKLKGRLPSNPNTLLKYRAVQARFATLHNVQRLRFDDCIDTLCAEFFHCRTYICIILRSELPDVVAETPNPNQMNFFEHAEAKTDS